MLLMLDKGRRTPGGQILAALAEGARRLAVAADAALAAPFHWAEDRRVLGSLAELDDHALQDMGVTRNDLCDALSLAPLHDATALLATRRAERRAAQ